MQEINAKQAVIRTSSQSTGVGGSNLELTVCDEATPLLRQGMRLSHLCVAAPGFSVGMVPIFVAIGTKCPPTQFLSTHTQTFMYNAHDIRAVQGHSLRRGGNSGRSTRAPMGLSRYSPLGDGEGSGTPAKGVATYYATTGHAYIAQTCHKTSCVRK